MNVDPSLPEDLRTALALVKAHVCGDADGWRVLADGADHDEVATALVRVVGVFAQLSLPGAVQHDGHLEPAAVDELLAVVARAFSHEVPS